MRLQLAAFALFCLPVIAAGISRAQEPALERIGAEASAALFRVYEADPSLPLDGRTLEKRRFEGHIREKVVFRGAQGFLVPGYLQFPEPAKALYPCVLLLHGWSGSKEHFWIDGNTISGGDLRKALLSAGFAVLALDAQCHGERMAVNDFSPVNPYLDEKTGQPVRKGAFTLPDIYIQTIRDYRRAIDYLQQRGDIDMKRIGVVGYSMGGTQTYLLTGVEPRIKAAVSVAAPAEKDPLSPVAPQSFVRGIGARPFLAIMGDADPMCSAEHARARHRLAESPNSVLIIVQGTHRLPASYVKRAAEFLREHL